MDVPDRYPIRLGGRSRLPLRVLFGATPDTAWAELRDGQMIARFGRSAFHVPLADIVRYRIEGPFRWITAIGIRRSIRHADLSFAGSPHGGVRMDFRTPVRWGALTVPALYVGADDLDAFASALTEAGIIGEDARVT
jgi:hypothetical protein